MNTPKLPIDRKTLRNTFPNREIQIRKAVTVQGQPAVRLSVEGVPRDTSRDPYLSHEYQLIDHLKSNCMYAGKHILY